MALPSTQGLPAWRYCAPGVHRLPDMQSAVMAQAQRVLAFGASFKKMDQVRKNLEAVAAHPGEELVLDPNGYAIVPSADQQALQN